MQLPHLAPASGARTKLPLLHDSADALALASELRAERLRVEVYPEANRKLEKPLKYASARNVPVPAKALLARTVAPGQRSSRITGTSASGRQSTVMPSSAWMRSRRSPG